MNNAYKELFYTEITSSTAAIDMSNVMSATYDTYYILMTDVTLDADGGLKVVPKVSNVTETVENTNVAGRYASMSGSMGRRITGNYSTRNFIVYMDYFDVDLTGGNSHLEGWILNSQSSSHNTYSIFNHMGTADGSVSGVWGYIYRQQMEIDNENVYDGLYITPVTATNIETGKFHLYGMLNS